MIFKISLFVAIANAQDRYVPCPVVSPAQGVFSASQIKKGALVAVEAGDDEYPINLVLYKYENGLCREELVAKYSIEGAAPQVDSLFFWENKRESESICYCPLGVEAQWGGNIWRSLSGICIRK